MKSSNTKGYKSNIPLFCKYCGNKKVKWVKYTDEKKQVRWMMIDIETGKNHNLTCPSPISIHLATVFEKKVEAEKG